MKIKTLKQAREVRCGAALPAAGCKVRYYPYRDFIGGEEQMGFRLR